MTILARGTCYIDNTALVSHHVKLGDNLFIGPYTNIYDGVIGNGTKIGAYTEIGGATIGERCKIQAHCFLPAGVHIGNEVFIGPRVVFTNDKYPRATGTWVVMETFVEDGASIGAGAIITPGIRIGAEAMVGAGAVVTKDVPPGKVFAGNPAVLLEKK